MNGILHQDSIQSSNDTATLPSRNVVTSTFLSENGQSELRNEVASLVDLSLDSQNMKDPLSLNLKSVTKETLSKSEVPDVSYASSDDDDCFFDANEDSLDIHSPDKEIMNLKNNKSNSASKHGCADGGEGPVDGQVIDYDRLYDSEDDDDLDTMEVSHGSVISHLISQVKIGMDLTKVALPTFILERRSLLEVKRLLVVPNLNK